MGTFLIGFVIGFATAIGAVILDSIIEGDDDENDN